MAVEIANSRTSVWAAKSTPSAVASNGPIVKRTVSPARVKTLTRTTAAGRIVRPMIASGPRYPPRTKAPSDWTVAATAFVSGLRRW